MKKSIENVKYIEFEMINHDAILIDTEHLLNLSVENIHVSHKYDSFMQKLLEYKYCEFLYVLISKSAKEVFPRLLKEHDISLEQKFSFVLPILIVTSSSMLKKFLVLPKKKIKPLLLLNQSLTSLVLCIKNTETISSRLTFSIESLLTLTRPILKMIHLLVI